MITEIFKTRKFRLETEFSNLIQRANTIDPNWTNGIIERYIYPAVTAAHIPLNWRYDFNPETNPYLLERLGVNTAFNAGAIELDGKIFLVVRVEGYVSQ